jgi:hypothetical protein
MTDTNNLLPGYITEFKKEIAATQSRSFGTPAPSDPAQTEESLRAAIPEDMIRQVTRKIEHLQQRLVEHRGFDNAGEPIYVLGKNDHRRQAMEKELYFLMTHTLPATQARAAHVAAAKAALPTPAQKLRAEVERKQRIRTAALAKAEDLEIEELAKRILADRRRAGGQSAA